MLRQVFGSQALATLATEIDALYASSPSDGRAQYRDPGEDEDYRYAMFNRCAAAQRAAGHPEILKTIEPLLGEDCHIIANTCWRNPPRPGTEDGGAWHIDGGPHVPRPNGIPWDERVPYPVFVIGCHIYLKPCPMSCGPTGVIPGSHKSGQPPPPERLQDAKLSYAGQDVVALTAAAGDVALFVSDVWHRRLATGAGDTGRLFLQVHYGRRDIAQRVLTTDEVNHVTRDAQSRIGSERERRLLGFHDPGFYDG